MLVDRWNGVPTDVRVKGFIALNNECPTETAYNLEAGIHSISLSTSMYEDKILQILHNVRTNKKLLEKGDKVIVMSDAEMAEGTIVEDIENQQLQRFERFDQMLQDKYETLNDRTYTSTLKCRRCGSSDVSWEQKQTRGADEAMTVFCTCAKCKNRWKMS